MFENMVRYKKIKEGNMEKNSMYKISNLIDSWFYHNDIHEAFLDKQIFHCYLFVIV